jgi:arylsulfatase
MNPLKKLSFSCSLFLFVYQIALCQNQPNIIIMFPDNLGYGEVSAYGGARNVPTPNIDRIGAEGFRSTNFNVEYSCTVSRIAMLTGRYAVRTGKGYKEGMTLWETTIAEALKSVGYATALYGKWHVGGGGNKWKGRREPTQQGFDEWWGIPNTSHWAQFTSFENYDTSRATIPYIWKGKAGAVSERVKPYDLESRRTIDREAAQLGVQFIERNVKAEKPFFLYLPMTHLHFPTLPHPDFAGKTGAGDMGDSMADVDYNVGLILNALERLGIEENTLVIWCTDNGAEMRRPWRGLAGPWRGFYNTAMEGGIRTPFVARWPSRIPKGLVSNGLLHQVDVLPTIAAAVGRPDIVPNDRIIDGVNQLPFLTGTQENSNRESLLSIAREGHIMAVKWRDWKLWYHFYTEMPDPNPRNLLRLFDLRVDPREENDVKDFYPWVIGIMDGIVADYEASLIRHPRVPADIDDPYIPPKKGSGKAVATYKRTDRKTLGPRTEALPHPNFSGTWSTKTVSAAPPTGQAAPLPVASLGSGWGDAISIIQDDKLLQVERVYFRPREIQPLIKYRYDLDGNPTKNRVNMGRSAPPTVSTTTWEGNRLRINTNYPFINPKTGKQEMSEVIQTLWLEPATRTPFEPKLVVETTRKAALNGKSSTNRTVYNRGYR